MAIGRKKALERLEALAPRVEEHLTKIEADPGGAALGHWQKEVMAWLEQMEAAVAHVGKRTGVMWSRTIDEWRKTLEQYHGDR